MISYPRSSPSATVRLRILGIGNAGVHLADRLAMSGDAGTDVVVMNTDAQSLTSSVVTQKLALGPKVTRGLGAGGDPEIGYQAAQESLGEIRDLMKDVDLIFLCGGLGGGTASGVAPVVAEMARESGVMVFSLFTSPFSFEGRRRNAQAAEALGALGRQSDAVIHFENDRMAELAGPRSGIEETFAAADATLLSCVASLAGILGGGAPLPVGLTDLLSALGGGTSRALFGQGTATGDNRAHEALEVALKSPLLDRGRLLNESHAVVVHLSGPPSFAFAEVAAIMRGVTKHVADAANVFLGVTTASDPSTPVQVTILGNYDREAGGDPVATPRRSTEPSTQIAPASEPKRKPRPLPIEETAPPSGEEPKPLFPEPSEPDNRPVAPVRSPSVDAKPRPRTKPAPKSKQETLQFESVARGRFEKSEPTIVEGEDLDVPTFLRMRGNKP
jgi:cell division protein FtsZ